jgi:hypothetical protein
MTGERPAGPVIAAGESANATRTTIASRNSLIRE